MRPAAPQRERTPGTPTLASPPVCGYGGYADDLLRRFPPRTVPTDTSIGTASIGAILQRLRTTRIRNSALASSTSGAEGMLRWLSEHAGDTWQQRWTSSGIERHAGAWLDEPLTWLRRHGHREDARELKAGFMALTAAEVLFPSMTFVLSRPRDPALTKIMATHRDPDGFATIETSSDADQWTSAAGRLARWHIAVLLAAKGGTVSDITVGDCVQLRQIEVARETSGSRRYQFYTLLRAAGQFPADAPVTLRRVTAYAGQRTPEQLVDRYQLQNQEIRNLLVDYLTERQPGLDYTTLEAMARRLGSNFWKDLELHNPGIDSLKLDPQTAAAWKERLRNKTTRTRQSDGTMTETIAPRRSYIPILHQVRAFYLDLAQWATEDPARWAQWAVPSPISASEVLLKKTFAQRKARIDQRTRDLRPYLPTIVDNAAKRAQDAHTRLQAALTATDDNFTVGGETFTRAVLTSSRGSRRQFTTVIDAAGRKRQLLEEENRAFWGWAAVEFLRHTGVRIEEMLETSHHSITQYQLPTTGEIIPLLHIAPSKTDQERLLVVSPDLADVLATIVTRVRGDGQAVPLVPFYDENERSWEAPAPLLFQWTTAGHRQALSTGTIRIAIREAFEASDLKDADGQPLYFRPHDFRRIFTTDAILNGMPPHIAQLLLGHKDINTTMGYKAIYPEEAINGHRAFIARRRALRPGEEYRTPTDAEWDEFLGHFERRKLALGDCGRAYGTSCQHEHSCIRCPVLRIDPAQRSRLETIRDNLAARVAEAENAGWLGEADGLRTSLAAAEDKLAQLDRRARQRATIFLDTPSIPEITARTAANPTIPVQSAAMHSTQ